MVTLMIDPPKGNLHRVTSVVTGFIWQPLSGRGEATAAWNPYVDALQDIKKIPASALDVLVSGCICLDGSCTKAECPKQADAMG